ncbi:MAG: sigma-70 family RNA polymerase sigma factor [Clostridia bacterium]|nr:sigma-70 family RNA polymerase sigma factor [Clostridia bacterium]
MTAEQDRLVTENIGLVHACARRYMGRGIDYDDLYQSGCEGLVKAAAGYDSSRSVRFSTYAVPAILGEIRRLFRDGGSMRVSRSLRDLGLKIRRAEEEFRAAEGRDPTVSELAALLDVTPESIAEALDASRPVISLTAEYDGEECEGDIPSGQFDEALIDIVALRESIAALSEADREIIRLRYFAGKTQVSVAKILGMTQVQVSRRERRIIQCMREQMMK